MNKRDKNVLGIWKSLEQGDKKVNCAQPELSVREVREWGRRADIAREGIVKIARVAGEGAEREWNLR